MTKNYVVIKQMGDLLTEYYSKKDINENNITDYSNLGYIASEIVNSIPVFNINNYENYVVNYSPALYDNYERTLGINKRFINADYDTKLKYYDYTSDAVNLMDYYIKHITALSKFPNNNIEEKEAIFEHLYNNSYIIPEAKILKKIR